MPEEERPSFERKLPHDIDAEMCVLGGMLLSKDAIADVVETIKPDDHYRPAHQLVHEAILELHGQGKPADAVTVAALMVKQGTIGKAGGHPYLHTLTQKVPTAANAGYYARIVLEMAILRRLVEVGTRTAARGYSGDSDPADLVGQSEADVLGILGGRGEEECLPLSQAVPGALDDLEARGKRKGISGVPTGFADLDAVTDGLQPGQMITLAGRPALGKSTAALDIARAVSIHNGKASVIFSLEMSRSEIVMRLLSAEARVPLHSMRTGQMTNGDWDAVNKHLPEVLNAPMFIDDSPGLNMTQIRAKARRLKQRHDLRLVIVDYLQLMSSPKRVENRQTEVSEMSRNLKLLAKELEVPVIAVAQLNRGPEQRTDHKPLLSDLRESGSIENDSDMVILLHREDAYDKQSPRAGEADFILAKHRNGPTCTVTVAFQGHFSRFVDMAKG